MTEKKYLDYPGLQAYDEAIKSYTASSENNGMMSSTDKDKLDNMPFSIVNGTLCVTYYQEVSSTE